MQFPIIIFFENLLKSNFCLKVEKYAVSFNIVCKLLCSDCLHRHLKECSFYNIVVWKLTMAFFFVSSID